MGHEPPVSAYLPDHDEVVAAAKRMKQVYLESGLGPAMARFFGLLMTSGELPAGFADQPTPDPAQFGLPTVDDGDRTNLLFRNVPSGLDFAVADSVRDLGDRVVIGVGAESHDELAARGAASVAEHLGVRLVEFPGGHGGFSGGEYGQPAGDPDGFATRAPSSPRLSRGPGVSRGAVALLRQRPRPGTSCRRRRRGGGPRPGR